MGLELAIFLLVGFISIFAAVAMLVSDNAVHSALFLILNFVTVAFMYLMLNAPFLALVQITVYAGAIMVLFLFVIMLLGAERVLPEPVREYGWLTPAAIGLVAALFLIASIAILEGQIDDSEPVTPDPMVRVIQGDSTIGLADLYLDDTLILSDMEYSRTTDFEDAPAGDFILSVVPRGESVDDAVFAEPITLEGGDVLSLVILPEALNGRKVITVADSIEPLEEPGTAHLTVVHAACNAATSANCSEFVFDIANTTRENEPPVVFAEDVEYGSVTDTIVLTRDLFSNHVFEFAAFTAGEIDEARAGEDDTSGDLEPAIELATFEVEDNHSYLLVIGSDSRAETAFRFRPFLTDTANRASFGSARSIGQVLFIDYVLPFQMIGILLLVSMIGVIILTKEAVETPQRRKVRRMAAIPGNPTVDEYLQAMESGQPLPPPSSTKQLPEGTGD